MKKYTTADAEQALHRFGKSDYNRYYIQEGNSAIHSQGSSRPIGDNDPNHKLKVRNGWVEISEQEALQLTLDDLRTDYQQTIDAIPNGHHLRDFMDASLLDEIGTANLHRGLQDSACEILMAREALETLHSEMAAYEKGNPGSTVLTKNESDGKISGKAEIRPPSRRLRSLIGRVVNHCQISLDYLAWASTFKTFRRPPTTHADVDKFKTWHRSIYWPKLDQAPTQASLPRQINNQIPNRICWIEDASVNLMLRDQPYNGIGAVESHPLIWLRDISNWHKHRSLSVAALRLHGWTILDRANGSVGMSGGVLEDGEETDFSFIRDVPDNDPRIHLKAAVDVSIEGIAYEFGHSVTSSSNGSCELSVGYTTLEIILRQIILYVEERWMEFERAEQLLIDADTK